MKRFLSVIFVLVLLSTSLLAGCGEKETPLSDDSPTALKIGDLEISEAVYRYWMSRNKAYFLYHYLGATEDAPDFWKTKLSDDITYGDFLTTLSISQIRNDVICLHLFREYGLSLNDMQKAAVNVELDTLIEEAGGRIALDKALADYGIHTDLLREILTMEAEISVLEEHLYGEKGVEAVTDEELDQYYHDSYRRCLHLLLRTDVKNKLDENGEPIVKDDTYVTEPLTEAEIASQKSLGKELFERAKQGESFEELTETYTEDTAMGYYTDGYYLDANCTFLPESVVKAVFDMEIGDIRKVESEYGIHLIKRLDLKDNAYKEEPYATAMFTDFSGIVSTAKLQKKIAGYADKLVTDEKVTSQWTMMTVLPDFHY